MHRWSEQLLESNTKTDFLSVRMNGRESENRDPRDIRVTGTDSIASKTVRTIQTDRNSEKLRERKLKIEYKL